ncbi:MAG: hypothetical protein LLF94_04155 [Chlamydiales bacterium]|nr:hypothetical protein [Chlamydiales bacterium]
MAELTPDDALRQGLNLFKSYDAQTHDKMGRPNDVKIQSLFLVNKPQGLEFVDKKSFRGVIYSLTDKLCKYVGLKGPLDSAKNLAKAQLIFQQATKAANAPTDEQKRSLNQVANALIQLQHTQTESSNTPHIDIRLPFGDIAKRVQKVSTTLQPDPEEPVEVQNAHSKFDACLAVLGGNNADISMEECEALVKEFLEQQPSDTIQNSACVKF